MLLDIFNNDVFGVSSLTSSLNILPAVPSRLGAMNLFTPKPIATTTAMLERQHGKISVLGTRVRGSGQTQTNSRSRRDMRSVPVPHIPQDDAVLADEVQNVRAFGSESELELVSNIVNNKLQTMRQNHEVTAEYHRAGAVKGEILDDDGSTIINLFTLFGVTEKVFSFNFSTTAGEFKQQCIDVARYMRDTLSNGGFGSVTALCGDEFYDNLIGAPEVRESYLRFSDGANFARGGPSTVFSWGGINWENYNGKVGTTDFMEPDECRFFPVGVPQLFEVYYAPADYMETVNTLGKPFYAKQERMKFDKGIELQSQSNPLHMCNRPEVLAKGEIGTAAF